MGFTFRIFIVYPAGSVKHSVQGHFFVCNPKKTGSARYLTLKNYATCNFDGFLKTTKKRNP